MSLKSKLLIVVTGVFFALSSSLSRAQTQGDSEPQSCTTHFVPNSQEFWDDSEHWTTNYGPAYRDTVEAASNFVPCTGQYALCFHSGPEPLPCVVEPNGRFADCKCTVGEGLNFVTISSILNYDVYLQTIAVCGVDGSNCVNQIDKAPVCQAMKNGTLIPGADVISDFSPEITTTHTHLLETETTPNGITHCSKGPYAGCMTAPCKITGAYAECSCPVFWGPFTILQSGIQCDLGNDLIWSSAYLPAVDGN